MQNDKHIIRELAAQTAEIAALPIQQETKRLWRALNALKPERPMVILDQLPWHELNADGELTLRCKGELARGIENTLRQTLYKWRHTRADMVVEPYIEMPKVITGAHFGIGVQDLCAVLDPQNDVVGHSYADQIQTEEDIQKITMPNAQLDVQATEALEAQTRELLCGELDVHMQGMFPNFAVWDRLSELKGVSAALMDIIDRPEFVHALMSRYTEASFTLLDQLEERGLMGCNPQYIHCTGAYSDELPAEGFDPSAPRAKDNWTYGMAQMFSTVSPAMHEEFDIDYAVKWYARFGLGYYGCCEPLDRKIDIIRRLPNLRKISISPWADVERAASSICGDYAVSRKPNPAFLATNSWDINIVTNDLNSTADICKRYNCPVEFILKDVSTVSYQPQRLWEWAEAAMDIAKM